MQEVKKSAGNKLLVVHFFDPHAVHADFRKPLEEIAKKYDGFVMVEINKYVDSNASNKPELEKSIVELQEKYLPGYKGGVDTINPRLVFFHGDEMVHDVEPTEDYIKSQFEADISQKYA